MQCKREREKHSEYPFKTVTTPFQKNVSRIQVTMVGGNWEEDTLVHMLTIHTLSKNIEGVVAWEDKDRCLLREGNKIIKRDDVIVEVSDSTIHMYRVTSICDRAKDF